jgi:tRNA pseudouridine55 synthase
MKLFGLLNINKPAGMTSRDVVNVVQRLVRKKCKVGHAGTLDPLATGVLVLCLGPATRLIEYVQRMPKSYHGKFLLGSDSPTEDIEGEIAQLLNPPVPSLERLESAAGKLTGEIQQRPPDFSALKIKGRRAYDLARAGKPVELASRGVKVHDLSIVRYNYPELSLDIRCGSGTYIRSLGRDLAELVGTAAVMSELNRTAIGEFGIEDAIALDSLTEDRIAAALKPALLAVAKMPKIEIATFEQKKIIDGCCIQRDSLSKPRDGEYAAVTEMGDLLAILVDRGQGRLAPVRVFNTHQPK